MSARPRVMEALRGLTPGQGLVVAIAALLPVVHSGMLLRSYRTPQLALIIVALGGMGALLFRPSVAWLRQETRPIQVAVVSVGSALLWMTAAGMAGVDPVRSLMGDPFRSSGLLLWYASVGLFLVALRHRVALYRRVADATILAWLVLLFFVALWLAAPAGTKDLVLLVSPDGVPLPGMGQSVYLAAFAGVGALMAMGKWLGAPRRGYWLVLSAALVGFMVLTEARVPVAATALAIAGGGVMMVRRGKPPLLVLVVLAVCMSAALASQTGLAPLRQKSMDPRSGDLAPLTAKLTPQLIADGLSVRQTWWTVAARAVARNPIAGNGPANFVYSYRRLISLDEAERVPDPNIEVADAHNVLLEVAATSGVVPAVLFLTAAIAWLMSLRGSSGKDPDLTWLRLALVVLAATMLTQPVALSVLPLLGIFAGVSAGGGSAAAKSDPPAWGVARRVPAVALVALSVALAASLIRSDQLLARGSLEWDSGTLERALSLDPTCQECLYELGKVRSWDFKREGRGSFAEAVAPFERAVASHPLDSESHLRLGTGLIFLERHEEALVPLSKARRLHPFSPRIAIALGAAQLQAGDAQSSLDNALAAIGIEPTAIAWELAAEAYSRLGRSEQARSALAEADRLAKSSA